MRKNNSTIKNNNIKVPFYKKITKENFLTIFSFFIGFFLEIVDMSTLHYLERHVYSLSQTSYIISYILLVLFLILNVKGLLKLVNVIQITKKDMKKGFLTIFWKELKLFLIGFYLGFLVNLANAFVLVLFDKYLIM